MKMLDNTILLMIGLFGFCVIAIVGEALAKIFNWE